VGVLLLPISDVHIGRDASGMDEESLDRRFSRYLNDVLEFVKILNKPVDEVNVMLLGDIVDGEEVYRGHGYELLYNIDEQIDIALYLFDKMYTFLSSVSGNIKFHCVPGNHGISNRRGKGNWDYMLCVALARTLPVVNYKDEEIATFEAGGYNIAMYHGHGIRMYMNIPWYGIDRRIVRWGYMKRFDMVFMGHFHTFGKMQVMDKTVYLNGTMLGDDPWSRVRLGGLPATRWWSIFITDGRIIETGVKLDWD